MIIIINIKHKKSKIQLFLICLFYCAIGKKKCSISNNNPKKEDPSNYI